ncbi:peptidase S8/S53 domain-containing protein, partial [Apiospora phragmitis]
SLIQHEVLCSSVDSATGGRCGSHPGTEGGVFVYPRHFIVVLKPDSTQDQLHSSVEPAGGILGGSKPKLSYTLESFKGYHVSASDDLIKSIANLGEVAYVEPDATISINALEMQTDAPWGLAPGADTYAYIIDTGIYLEHEDFEGRATFGASFVDGDASETDGNGHGTHVAGTTGSKTYYVHDLLKHAPEWTRAEGIGKAVANMSLGASRLVSQSVNNAAAAAVRAGLFLSVAAGNDGSLASLSSPASEPSVCTMAATDATGRRASFSSFGTAVDVFAPGVDILSTWNDGATNTISGTSMAAPHVTGLGAYLLALEGARDPIALCERIQELATSGIVKNSLTPNNLLAFNGADSSA